MFYLSRGNIFFSNQFFSGVFESSHRVLTPRRFSEKRVAPHVTAERVCCNSAVGKRNTQKGKEPSASRSEGGVVLWVLVALQYLSLLLVMSPKMVPPKTRLETMSPKLHTMSHQTYGQIQPAGWKPKQEQIQSSPRDSAMQQCIRSRLNIEIEELNRVNRMAQR